MQMAGPGTASLRWRRREEGRVTLRHMIAGGGLRSGRTPHFFLDPSSDRSAGVFFRRKLGPVELER